MNIRNPRILSLVGILIATIAFGCTPQEYTTLTPTQFEQELSQDLLRNVRFKKPIKVSYHGTFFTAKNFKEYSEHKKRIDNYLYYIENNQVKPLEGLRDTILFDEEAYKSNRNA